MKNKFYILLTIILIAVLAGTLAACSGDSNLNSAATITININRLEAAKDAELEINTSYGEITRTGDSAAIKIDVRKDFLVTVSSFGFKTASINVQPKHINKNIATYDVNFGETISEQYVKSFAEEYENLTVTCNDEVLEASIANNQLTVTNKDKYSNGNLTIAADGYETMEISFKDLFKIPTISLVKSGNIQIIYQSNDSSAKVIKNERHNLYTPKYLGGAYYFEVPNYGGDYYYSSGYTKLINIDKPYGNIIGSSARYSSNSQMIFIGYDLFNYYNNNLSYKLDLYSIDKDGNFIERLFVRNFGNKENEAYYLEYNALADKFILLDDDKHIIIEIKDFANFLPTQADFLPLEKYYTVTNNYSKEIIDKFSFTYTQSNEDGSVTQTVNSVDGKINLTNVYASGDLQYDYNGDSYSTYFRTNDSPSSEQNNQTNFADGKITFRNFIMPDFDIRVKIYDKETLLTGEHLTNFKYLDDGFYIINADRLEYGLNFSLHKNNFVLNNYISMNKNFLKKIGDKMYEYERPLYLNNNKLFTVSLTYQGENILNSGYLQKITATNSLYTWNEYLYIEAANQDVIISFNYNNKTYKIDLNNYQFDNDNSLAIDLATLKK